MRVGTGDVAETRDCDGQGQAAGDGTARDPYGAPATGRDKVAATAALVMARTSTNVLYRLGGDRLGQVALKRVAVQEHDRAAAGRALP